MTTKTTIMPVTLHLDARRWQAICKEALNRGITVEEWIDEAVEEKQYRNGVGMPSYAAEVQAMGGRL